MGEEVVEQAKSDLEQKLAAAFEKSLGEFFKARVGARPAGRQPSGIEELPPEYQTQLKRIIAGEIDEGDRCRTFFDLAVTDVLNHRANLNAAAVAAIHNGTRLDNVANWHGTDSFGMWIDRRANPDEVAQLTETNRAAQAVQIDAFVSELAGTLAGEVAKIVGQK